MGPMPSPTGDPGRSRAACSSASRAGQPVTLGRQLRDGCPLGWEILLRCDQQLALRDSPAPRCAHEAVPILVADLRIPHRLRRPGPEVLERTARVSLLEVLDRLLRKERVGADHSRVVARLVGSQAAHVRPEGELEESIDFIGVLGNADSKPIITPSLKEKFPTNWELASARGATVTRYLLEKSRISPSRMVAMGLGEFWPIADNDSEKGRGNNRRVDIILLPVDVVAAIVVGAEIK